MASFSEIFSSTTRSGEDQWISVSDLMAALMIIFLFIAITYMRDIKSVAVAWATAKEELYRDLYEEFHDDLPKWNAEIDPVLLSVRFLAPSVLFDPGKSSLKPKFRIILKDFFPRYIRILDQYREFIEEVRVEGHTSSEWIGASTPEEAYFRNMRLSQDRTRAVLEYCYMLSEVRVYREWAMSRLTANGLSSSRLRRIEGKEDFRGSRRVEFRVRTNADEQINRILELGT